MIRSLRWTAVAVALFLLPGLAVAQPVFSPGQDPLAGSQVFGTKGCAKCHSVNGVGGKVGPDLARVARPRSFFDLATAMWNHLANMTERMKQLGIDRPKLDDREARDLIAFLYTLSYFDAPGNPNEGRRLFNEKRCLFCHQVGGTGGVVGPNLDALKQFGSPMYVTAAMWNHGPAMMEKMREKGIELHGPGAAGPPRLPRPEGRRLAGGADLHPARTSRAGAPAVRPEALRRLPQRGGRGRPRGTGPGRPAGPAEPDRVRRGHVE
jgi:cytochrome c2